MPTRVKVVYFAQAREMAGAQREEVVLGGSRTTDDLLKTILKAHPKLKGLISTLRVSVNQEVAMRNVRLEEGDEVGILPPVAGG